MAGGRSILVTGAGRGLGLAIAKEAVARGHSVIGTLRDRGRGAGLVELAAREPDGVRVLRLDVSDEAACSALRNEVARLADHLDVVINNAGINSGSPEVGGK